LYFDVSFLLTSFIGKILYSFFVIQVCGSGSFPDDRFFMLSPLASGDLPLLVRRSLELDLLC